ncbi:hypothetical protein J6590_039178 [Homalodisca vitripennis]|nr:hypothetical protein J6590_039178 [Homalodisca vitripennis]
MNVNETLMCGPCQNIRCNVTRDTAFMCHTVQHCVTRRTRCTLSEWLSSAQLVGLHWPRSGHLMRLVRNGFDRRSTPILFLPGTPDNSPAGDLPVMGMVELSGAKSIEPLVLYSSVCTVPSVPEREQESKMCIQC